MTIQELLLAEFDQETGNTRKMLERVPEEKFAWKPHEKSPELAKLANHVAKIPALASIIVNKRGAKPEDAETKAALLEAFDRNAASYRETISALSEDRLSEKILVTPTIAKPLAMVLRTAIMNHLVHHRGQLSLYLRLLDVPVPGMHGPSADEKS